jgi:dipeptidase E
MEKPSQLTQVGHAALTYLAVTIARFVDQAFVAILRALSWNAFRTHRNCARWSRLMINLAMYSDQVIPENKKVDERLLDLLAMKGRRIGYVPSGPEPDFQFYRQKQTYYARMGFGLDLFFDLEHPLSASRISELFACDAIHLPGGNTRSFLHRLRTCGLFEPLASWARNGGLLIGTSAGAILMTPSVALDAIFSAEAPENVRDGTGLNLVPFEFFPHLNAKAEYFSLLLNYSRNTSRMIAACRDGDGVVIDEGAIENIGNIVWISNGAVVEAPGRVC